MSKETIHLGQRDVLAALSPRDCIASVAAAFCKSALGEVPAPAVLAMHAPAGSYHVKAGLLQDGALYFAAKVNANFPENPARHGLPTIQGAVLLFDGNDGRLLAIMDSPAITALRTAAATAVAARYLARPGSSTLLICGCGAQALEQVRALSCVMDIDTILAFDVDAEKAAAFADEAERATGTRARHARDLAQAVRGSDIVVTCTPSKRAFLTRDMVSPGTFIAAVGADHEDKQELAPELLASSKLVTDLTTQASRMGDLHHAIAADVMTATDVHAQLGELAAGLKPGRTTDEEITVFDSTGTGLQDVAAAAAAYRSVVAGAVDE